MSVSIFLFFYPPHPGAIHTKKSWNPFLLPSSNNVPASKMKNIIVHLGIHSFSRLSLPCLCCISMDSHCVIQREETVFSEIFCPWRLPSQAALMGRGHILRQPILLIDSLMVKISCWYENYVFYMECLCEREGGGKKKGERENENQLCQISEM